MKTFRGFPLDARLGIALVVLLLSLSLVPALLAAEPLSLDDAKAIVDGRRDPVKTGDLYALVVGISDYAHVRKLRVSHNDAKAFGDFLQTQKDVFRELHVKVLLNQEATKREIEKFLTSDLLRAGKDDTVILFFSGHGAPDPKHAGDYMFLTYDTEPGQLAATAVKMSGLDFLKRLDARKVVVIADACHAGGYSNDPSAGVSTKDIHEPLTTLLAQFKASTGRVILTSCRPDEYSEEQPDLGQSLFTHHLLAGLKGAADVKRKGMVTLKEAYDYAYEHTKDGAKASQHPQWEGRVEGPFPMALVKRFDQPVELQVRVVAQDPRCTNKDCTDPSGDATECKDPLCGEVPVSSGGVMYSGQNYQVAFRTSSDCYVYVYHVGPNGDLYRLFPGTKGQYIAADNSMANPLKAGQVYWLPGKNNWYRQDDSVGQERIYIVASRTRNAILEDVYDYLERRRQETGAKDDVTADLERSILQRVDDAVMAPVVGTMPRKACLPSTASPDGKVRSFNEVCQAFESFGLDAITFVTYEHQRR
jgi:hypothetical protein